ncbi:MAG: tryptophan halogenase [Planctomyces sp.]|nr:tryptophan halogenase [Planctomyces sp.]
MTSHDQSPDVVVIGGGPAGSTAATMLARQGVSVLLLERETFPREHVGESLLPASIPVLEELGVLPAVEAAGFLTKWGATMVWGSDPSPWSWYFRETNQRNPHSYQVWRPQFDQLLLENSRAHGVDVREGHRVVEVLWDDGKTTGVRYQADSGETGTVQCRYVVDASGQTGLLARGLNLRQWDPFFQNLAVYGYFSGAQPLPEPDETNIFIEAYPHGWLWSIPLHTGWTSVGAVVDSATSQDEISNGNPERFLEAQIIQAPHTSRMLRNAHLEIGPFIVKDWSYVCERVAGDGYVLAGDAACFVDPLFSSGVHLALMSGILSAAYVTSALKDPEIAEPAAAAYHELYLKEYGHFREMARLFYSSNLTSDSYFWEARRLLEDAGNFTPRQAFIQAVAGQPPRGYERAVLEQGQAPLEFASSVRQVESERERRRVRWEAACSGTDTGDPILAAVPKLAPETQIQRKPILGAGEFVWGTVLTTVSQPEGTPCSGLISALVSRIDGTRTVAHLLDEVGSLGEPSQAAQIRQTALAALGILYVDGTVEELGGL